MDEEKFDIIAVSPGGASIKFEDVAQMSADVTGMISIINKKGNRVAYVSPQGTIVFISKPEDPAMKGMPSGKPN